MPRSNLHILPPVPPLSKRARTVLWISMIAGIIAAGTAFVFKVAEFIFTIGTNELDGFADVPVAVYFLVAAGWVAILGWCFLTGKFRDLERPKFEMLEQEEEYERRGE